MVGHSPIVGGDGDRVSSDHTLDVVFDALADRRRRHVLTYLADQQESIPRRDLVRDIAVRENEAPINEMPDEIVDSVAISLVHKDLPKLAEAGLVEYDRENDLVRAAEPPDRVGELLSVTVPATFDSAEERWG